MAHDEFSSCRCVSEHRPPVLEYVQHHIWPTSMGGPDTPGNRVWLCDNAHRNVHELLRLMLKADKALTETELENLEPRPVSRYAGVLARSGFLDFKEHQRGSGG